MDKQAVKVEEAVSKIIGTPIEPGTLIPVETFEDLLGISRGNPAFGFLISAIRYKLYHRGLYLSGEGVSQIDAYTIVRQ